MEALACRWTAVAVNNSDRTAWEEFEEAGNKLGIFHPDVNADRLGLQFNGRETCRL